MTRLIIPALVALLVSGPAWAIEDDAVLLHCSGEMVYQTLKSGGKNLYRPVSENFIVARDGSWIELQFKKHKNQSTNKRVWMFRIGNGKDLTELRIFPRDLTMRLEVRINKSLGPVTQYACAPIKNPLKF